VAKEWEIWDKEEKATKSEEETQTHLQCSRP